MPIRIVQLGSPRTEGEGLRLGTVRRPPRGVPKAEFASRNYYDVWLPNLSPSAELVAEGLAVDDDKDWAAFSRKYQAEMKQPDAAHLLAAAADRRVHTAGGSALPQCWQKAASARWLAAPHCSHTRRAPACSACSSGKNSAR